jgi:hypothetical protein
LLEFPVAKILLLRYVVVTPPAGMAREAQGRAKSAVATVTVGVRT